MKNKILWVIKAGSSLVATKDNKFNDTFVSELAYQINHLRKNNIEVVVVSSGAVAKGLSELNLKERPSKLHLLQAAAAVGQVGLINSYKKELDRFNIKTAQVLVSHDDFNNRTRYINARRSLHSLLELGIVPIVNENDSVATEEISFGDNDTLAGMIVGLVDASKFIMLTDQIGICSKNPNIHSDAKLVEEINIDKDNLSKYMEEESGLLGRGGIKTKIKAARMGLNSSSEVKVMDGRDPRSLLEELEGKGKGTRLISEVLAMPLRKQWISNLSIEGSIVLDAGACEAIISEGKSLLPVGVIKSTGDFTKGSLVSCQSEDLQEVAKGLINFSSKEMKLIEGHRSSEITSILKYPSEEEVIHRNNLVLSRT